MSLHKTSQEITGSGRVQIVYDVNGRAKELPFVVGILADLSGHSETPLPQLRRRRFIEIDRETFDRVMSAIRPRLVVDVRDVLRDTDTSLNVCLTFNGLEDFEPDNIVRQIPSLQDTLRTRQKLANLHGTLTRTLEDALREICLDHKELAEMRSEVSCPEAPEGGLLERLALQGSFGSSVYEVTIAKQWIREFFVQYLSGEIQLAPDIASMLSSRLNALDNALSRQVKLIMHEPAFRDLEAAWRELEFLVSRTERSPTLKTKSST